MQIREEQDHPLYQQGAKRPNGETAAVKRKKPPRAKEDLPYLTLSLMALNGLIFLVGFLAPEIELELFRRGAMFPRAVVEGGEVHRLFTAMFLHGGMAHLFFNVYALYIVGGAAEPIFGRLRFLLIYLLGGLTGSILSLLLGGLEGASVGASGAVFAVFTAWAVHLHQHRGVYANVAARLQHMLVLIGINLVIGFLPGSRIDNWGHIGGMLGGALLAWRIAPRLSRPAIFPRSMREFAKSDSNPLNRHWPTLVIYIAVLIALVIVAVAVFPSPLLDFLTQ